MCGLGDIAKYVLISGDPQRVETIAASLDESVKVADHRGFVTYTGNVDRTKVSACSTGIGCPSAAIAVEELANIGADTFVRVGTTGSLQPNIESLWFRGGMRVLIDCACPAVFQDGGPFHK